MLQPGSASAPVASAPPAPVATETVRRPDPGLGRGVWEAPALLFWIVGAASVVVAVAYALGRLGVLKRRGKKRT